MEAQEAEDEPQDAVQQRVAARRAHLLVRHVANVDRGAVGRAAKRADHGAEAVDHHALHDREEVASLARADVARVGADEVGERQAQHQVAVLLEGGAGLTPAGDAHAVPLQEVRGSRHDIRVLMEVCGLGEEVQDDTDHRRNKGCGNVRTEEALRWGPEERHPDDDEGDEAHDRVVREVRAEDGQQGVDAQPGHADASDGNEEGRLRHVLRDEGRDEGAQELEDAAVEVGDAGGLPRLLGVARGPEDRAEDAEGLRNGSRRVDAVGLRANVHFASTQSHLRRLERVVEVADEDR
mmetsp:Transcript_73993/g.190932  ORF Transcript_73993/g.190932 Transcript_73993/m.190932 type:complete len:294 (+) Transcript_73993:753-1634(+)